jgi:MFS family permease
MNSLTDRYVRAVLRAVPGRQRPELEPEVRALVADTIDAHGADERAALTELGDPGVLAARYTDQTRYLIGPGLYPEWRRLLTILLPILIPIIAIVTNAATLLGGSTIGEAIVAAGGAAIGVAVQTVFWVTLVFAIIERTTGTTGVAPSRWSVDDLPELPDDGRMSVFELGATIVVNMLVFAGLLWVQLQPPIVVDGQAFALLDPDLWGFWLPWFLLVLLAETLFTIALFVRGRWTWAFATINAALGAAFAVPALYLWSNDLLLNPALVDQISASTGSTWIGVSGAITMTVIVVVVIWDAIDGFRKARRANAT